MKLAISPAGAVLRGLAAGVAGTLGMSLFWKLTEKWRPSTRADEYDSPPESIQKVEEPMETLARRAVDGVAQRGPISPGQKKVGGQLVHYAFGAGWGALYGLVRESVPFMRTPAGMAAFSGAVWAISEGVLLPLMKLAPPLQERKVNSLGYYAGAHLVYGATTAAAYEAMRPATWLIAGSWIGAKFVKRALHKREPQFLKPVTDKLVDGTQYAIRKIANLPPLSRSL